MATDFAGAGRQVHRPASSREYTAIRRGELLALGPQSDPRQGHDRPHPGAGRRCRPAALVGRRRLTVCARQYHIDALPAPIHRSRQRCDLCRVPAPRAHAEPLLSLDARFSRLRVQLLASNHSDIALGVDEGLSAEGPAGADPDLAVRPLDWLRADRDSRAAATDSPGGNNAFRLRHYQINQEWTALAFVLEGRENPGLYAPGFEAFAEPFPTAEALADELVSLCGLEHVVLLEYLYAYYSLKRPEDFADPRSAADALFVRHELLGIAVSEMRHLRWANQLLWTLAKLGLIRDRGPALEPGRKVPAALASATASSGHWCCRRSTISSRSNGPAGHWTAIMHASSRHCGWATRSPCCSSRGRSWRRGWITTTGSARSASCCVPGPVRGAAR